MGSCELHELESKTLKFVELCFREGICMFNGKRYGGQDLQQESSYQGKTEQLTILP